MRIRRAAEAIEEPDLESDEDSMLESVVPGVASQGEPTTTEPRSASPVHRS